MKLSRSLMAAAALISAPTMLSAQETSGEETKIVGNIANEESRASDTATSETIFAGQNEEKVVCRRDKATGSRVTAKRICKTEKQWEIEREEQRRMIEKGQNQRTLTGG